MPTPYSPTTMVIDTVVSIFAEHGEDRAPTDALPLAVAHLIDATAATSFAKGMRRARTIVAFDGASAGTIARIDEALAAAEAINAREGYAARVSMLDPTGKILLLQVDGTPDEVRPLAQHLYAGIGSESVVVVLPLDSKLEAFGDRELEAIGLQRIPAAESAL